MSAREDARRAKHPLSAKHRRLFGRLYVKYRCGTCGKSFRWSTPYKAVTWFIDHDENCWEEVSE